MHGQGWHTPYVRRTISRRAPGCHVGCAVGRCGIQTTGAVTEEELAVPDVEGHVAEGQQLEQEHHEEDDAQAQERRRRAHRQVEERQACAAVRTGEATSTEGAVRVSTQLGNAQHMRMKHVGPASGPPKQSVMYMHGHAVSRGSVTWHAS